MTTDSTPDQATKQPLAPMLVGVAIFLFFPLGLYLLWRHPTLGKNAKWWASGIAWACFVLFMSNGAERTEKAGAPVSRAEPHQTAESSGESATARKKKPRKMPPMPSSKQKSKYPEAYREGWEQGVARGHEWLDYLETESHGTDSKKFLKEHPETKATLEQERAALFKEQAEAMSEIVNAVSSLVSSGVSKDTTFDHPLVVAAERHFHVQMGQTEGFMAVTNPLLSGK